MKKILAFLLILSACASLISCSAENGSSEAGETTVSVSETAGETDESGEPAEWTAGYKMTCSVHHFDYHMLPYELILHAGLDEVNAWLQECKISSANADSECPYSTCNVKSFIDHFNISRETFAVKGDLAYFAVYDCEMLYTESAEAIEAYFSDVETLQDESIKAQSYAFLFNRFVNDYTGTVFGMAVPDSTGENTKSPSLPQVVIAVEMPREKLEELIEETDAKTLEVCGKALRYDYDLDLIYNADGSFKELPELDGLEEYEKVMKYNSLFCKRAD